MVCALRIRHSCLPALHPRGAYEGLGDLRTKTHEHRTSSPIIVRRYRLHAFIIEGIHPGRVCVRSDAGRLCTNSPQRGVEQNAFFIFIFDIITFYLFFLLLQRLCAEGTCCTWRTGFWDGDRPDGGKYLVYVHLLHAQGGVQRRN